jgi:hypothetical protein
MQRLSSIPERIEDDVKHLHVSTSRKRIVDTPVSAPEEGWVSVSNEAYVFHGDDCFARKYDVSHISRGS